MVMLTTKYGFIYYESFQSDYNLTLLKNLHEKIRKDSLIMIPSVNHYILQIWLQIFPETKIITTNIAEDHIKKHWKSIIYIIV